MKKLLATLILVCLMLCTSISAYAAVDADGRPTPWEDPELNICVVETFSEFEDAEIDIMESYLWFSPDYATATKWEDGRYVITESPMIERYAFRFVTAEMGQSLTQEEQDGALGMGFYIENNTSQGFYAGPYMVGTSANSVVSQGQPLYLVDLDGNITKAEDTEGMGMALVPSGFRGHLVFFKEDLTGAGGTGAIPAGNYIGYPGFELVYSSVDSSKNESIVLDNVFFFGYNFDNKSRELIDEAVQSDYPVPSPVDPTQPPVDEPTQSPDSEPAQTSQNEQTSKPENTSEAESTDNIQASPSSPDNTETDDNLVWYIVGAVLILCAAVIVIIVMIRKTKGKSQQ